MRHSPLKVSSFSSVSQTEQGLKDAYDPTGDGGDFLRAARDAW